MSNRALQMTFWVSLMLILVGLMGRYLFGMRGESSVLPLVLGIVLGILGSMATDAEYAKRAMQGVALLSLLGVIGTCNVLPTLGAWLSGRPPDEQTADLLMRSVMLLLSGTLLLVCVGAAIQDRVRRTRR
jgi:hypothetical protein